MPSPAPEASKIGEYFIYAVGLFGILMLLIGNDVWTFGQTWVWMAITLYVIGVSNGRFVLMPRVGRLIALQRELVASGPPTAGSGPPPQVLEMEKVGKQVAAVGTALNLLLGVLLVLMVFKPGGP